MNRSLRVSFVLAGLSTVLAAAATVATPKMPLHADDPVCNGMGKSCDSYGDCDHWNVNGDCTHWQITNLYYPAAT